MGIRSRLSSKDPDSWLSSIAVAVDLLQKNGENDHAERLLDVMDALSYFCPGDPKCASIVKAIDEFGNCWCIYQGCPGGMSYVIECQEKSQ